MTHEPSSFGNFFNVMKIFSAGRKNANSASFWFD